MEYIDRLNEKYFDNAGFEFQIIRYNGNKDIDIKYLSDNTIIKNQSYGNLIRGNIKNPNNHKKLKYTDFFNSGKYNYVSHNGSKNSKPYKIWINIIYRCYDKQTQIKESSYVNCLVDEKWFDYQDFAKWYFENYVEGFQLDKDILIKGNKIYGPDTCCFVPKAINMAFQTNKKTRGDYPIGVIKSVQYLNCFEGWCGIGDRRLHERFNTIEEAFNFYKITKEKYMKWLALTWKNKINEKCFNALMNFTVNIND